MTEKTKPTNPEGYANDLSGDWNEVPEWAIKRINFLETVIESRERERCPLMDKRCPKDIEGMSCRSVKHCYPYLCDGTCGKANEIWIGRKEQEILRLIAK